MHPLDDHQRAAASIAVAVDDLNAALLEASRAGLLAGLVMMDAAERPNVRRVVAQCSVPVALAARGEL